MTTAQQKRLLDIMDGKDKSGFGGSKEITFKLRGTDIIGAIKNTESRMKG